MRNINSAISFPLSVIINQSLHSGIFPDRLKIAKVLPLFKKGEKDIFDNYRPISILPAISKIFEKIIYKQVFEYFVENKLFFESQHGFRQNHSTETACIEFVDFLKFEIDKGHVPLSIFIDLSKAFDSINHEISISQLGYYGFSGRT